MRAPLKICHLTTVHKPFDTRIFYKECLSLAKEHEVHLIAPHSRDEKVKNIQIHALPKPKNRFERLMLTGYHLYKLAKKIKADVYHFHDPEIIPWALLLQKKTGAKIIYDVHEMVRDDFAQKKWLPFKHFFKGAYMQFERLALKRFHFILAEKSYLNYYHNKTNNLTLVQNYPQPRIILNSVTEQDKKYLLLVGTLAGKRGLAITLNALALLKSTGMRINLICVGEKDERVDELLAQSKWYNAVKDQVKFLGYKPMPKAYENASECFAGLALLEDLPNHKESYPTKLFEYMAAGIPVICSDFKLYKNVVEKHHCGIYVNVNDANEIADAIGYLYRMPYQASKMGAAGRAAVENEFNWSTEEHKLLKLYNNLKN